MSTRQFIRRNIIKLMNLVGLSILMLLAGPLLVVAEDYPRSPINIFVGFSPGGAAGNSAQIFALGARKYLPIPQNVIVNFKPGASTAMAADYVLKQPADGYNLFLATPDIYCKLAQDADKLSFKMDDLIPIGTYGFTPQILVVNKEKSPFKKFEEFLDYAKKHPGQISIASPGIGSLPHLTIENLMLKCGIKLNHIPFGGGTVVVTNLLGGHVDCAITSPTTAGEHIKPGGGLRVLVFLIPERWPDLPEVPTCIEKGYDLNVSFWCSLTARKGTPQPILDILQKVFKKTADDPEVKANLRKIQFLPCNLGPEETKKKAKEDFDIAKEFYKKFGS